MLFSNKIYLIKDFLHLNIQTKIITKINQYIVVYVVNSHFLNFINLSKNVNKNIALYAP